MIRPAKTSASAVLLVCGLLGGLLVAGATVALLLALYDAAQSLLEIVARSLEMEGSP